jgi:hypothetical protein
VTITSLRIVGIACVVFAWASFAWGQVKTEIWNDEDLNRFIEIRWLAGSNDNQFESQFKALSDQIFNGIEQQRGKPFSKEVAGKLRVQLAEIAAQAQQKKPTDKQLQAQYNSWRACIAESYKSKLQSATQAKILEYYKQGALHTFIELQKQVAPWFGDAMNRAKHDGQKLFDQITLDRLKNDKAFQVFFEKMLATLLIVDTAFPKLMFVQNQFGTQAYMAVVSELNMLAMRLPIIAKKIGMTEEQFSALKAYANLNSDEEFKIYDACMRASQNASQPSEFEIWMQDFAASLMRFAQSNEAQLK